MSFNDSIGDIKMVDNINNSVRATMQQNAGTHKAVAPQKSDELKASGDGVDSITSQQVASELSKTPPVDLEAVNKIKAAIKKGEYPINLDVVAEKLMHSYIEMKT